MADTSLLRVPSVLQRTGFSRSELYRRIAAREFPKPLKRGQQSLWPSPIVEDWVLREINRLTGGPDSDIDGLLG